MDNKLVPRCALSTQHFFQNFLRDTESVPLANSHQPTNILSAYAGPRHFCPSWLRELQYVANPQMSTIRRLERWAGENDRYACNRVSLLTGNRRTGVTLDQQPLDAYGMEQISGIFSSPRKPSPLKNVMLMETVEESSMLRK